MRFIPKMRCTLFDLTQLLVEITFGSGKTNVEKHVLSYDRVGRCIEIYVFLILQLLKVKAGLEKYLFDCELVCI